MSMQTMSALLWGNGLRRRICSDAKMPVSSWTPANFLKFIAKSGITFSGFSYKESSFNFGRAQNLELTYKSVYETGKGDIFRFRLGFSAPQRA